MAKTARPVRVPPRWFVRTAWRVHRGMYRGTGGRSGLWPPSAERGWGALRLTTTGRRSGRERAVILGYLEDAESLSVLAMNGWGPAEPAWWLNLQAHPQANVKLSGMPPRKYEAHAAHGTERERLWEQWRSVEPRLDEYAALRGTPTSIVVLSAQD